MISNFRNVRTSNDIDYADVDVRCGVLWLKIKTETVYKENRNWRYLISGEYTPSYIVENLASAYIASLSLPNPEPSLAAAETKSP